MSVLTRYLGFGIYYTPTMVIAPKKKKLHLFIIEYYNDQVIRAKNIRLYYGSNDNILIFNTINNDTRYVHINDIKRIHFKNK